MQCHAGEIVRPFRRPGYLALLLTIALDIPVHSAPSSGAKDIVAIQLRAQGIPCTSPSKAVKDVPESSRDEMAWIISCKEAIYRVKLIPHVGSRVEIIDNSLSDIDVINGR